MATQYKGFKASDPVARIARDGKYEVFFCIYRNGKKTQFTDQKGINSLPQKQRRKAAEDAAAVLLEALENGWNPLEQKYPVFENAEASSGMTLETGLNYAIAAKRPHLSKYSLYDYEGAVRFIKTAARETGHLYDRITAIDRMDVKSILAVAKQINTWSANSRNKCLERFRSLLSVLVDDEILKFNPAFRIKDLPVHKTLGYKRLTDDEKVKIAEHLSQHQDFFEYCMFIYHSGIRRTELLQVKVKDIDLAAKVITIRAVVAKMKRERKIPITADLMQILVRRRIGFITKDYFLFSENFKPGAGCLHPNTATNWWHKLVIVELGIDCKLYSLKHKGADDKINAGISLDALKTLYGHKSKIMTETYAQVIKEKYMEKIIELSPGFVKGR